MKRTRHMVRKTWRSHETLSTTHENKRRASDTYFCREGRWTDATENVEKRKQPKTFKGLQFLSFCTQFISPLLGYFVHTEPFRSSQRLIPAILSEREGERAIGGEGTLKNMVSTRGANNLEFTDIRGCSCTYQ